MYAPPAENIILLTDDQLEFTKLPTRHNIMKGFQWLMRDLKTGDSLFFYFAGAAQRCQAFETGRGVVEVRCRTARPPACQLA